jgi:cobalamin biosynthesis Mg chelatase CobN
MSRAKTTRFFASTVLGINRLLHFVVHHRTEAAMVRNSILLQEEVNATADDNTNKEWSKSGSSNDDDDSDSSEHSDDENDGENTDAPTIGSDTNDHNITAEVRQEIQKENRGVSMWRSIFKIILIVVAILLVIATYLELSHFEKRDFTSEVSNPYSVVIEWNPYTLLPFSGPF